MIRLLILFGILLALMLTSDANSFKGSSLIVGGQEVDITVIPYQISLQCVDYGHICGGSIISTEWIISAAHCIGDNNNTAYEVRIGSSTHAKGGELILISKIVNHPNYDPTTIDYDVSLLKLARHITLGNNAKVIALPLQNETVPDHTPCTVSGWGTKEELGNNSNVLQAAVMVLINQKLCKNAFEGMITDRMICANSPEHRGICSADSGGPLVANGKLFGIASWGLKMCGHPNFPDVFTRVASVRNWIHDITHV